MTRMWKKGLAVLGIIAGSASLGLAQTATPKTIVPTPIANQGTLNVSFVAIAELMKFQNTAGTVQLIVRNKTTQTCTITVTSVAEPTLGRLGNVSATVPTATAGTAGISILGPFSPAGFNQKSPAANLGYVLVTAAAAPNCDGADIAVISHQ